MKKRLRPSQVKKAVERQQEKERAKVAAHVHKLQQLAEGDQNPHIQQLSQQLELLVKGHNDLANAYNVNWKNFADSIKHLDARLGAMAIVFDDFVRGGVENVTKLTAVDAPEGHPAIGGVHWPGYVALYMKKVEEELAQLRAQAEAAQNAQIAPFDPLLTPVPQDEAEPEEVFGGKEYDGEASPGLQTSATG